MSADELSAAQLADLGNRLETLRSELEAQIEHAGDSARPVELDQQSVGRLSRMDAIQQQSMAQAQERRRQGRLRAIDAALRRMEEGEYGYCEDCGEDIAAARLNHDPTAVRCIDCARG